MPGGIILKVSSLSRLYLAIAVGAGHHLRPLTPAPPIMCDYPCDSSRESPMRWSSQNHDRQGTRMMDHRLYWFITRSIQNQAVCRHTGTLPPHRQRSLTWCTQGLCLPAPLAVSLPDEAQNLRRGPLRLLQVGHVACLPPRQDGWSGSALNGPTQRYGKCLGREEASVTRWPLFEMAG
jgi:hypothetical protein